MCFDDEIKLLKRWKKKILCFVSAVMFLDLRPRPPCFVIGAATLANLVLDNNCQPFVNYEVVIMAIDFFK